MAELLEALITEAGESQSAPSEDGSMASFENFAKQFLNDHDSQTPSEPTPAEPSPIATEPTTPAEPAVEPAPQPTAEAADSWASLRDAYGKKYADDAALAEGALNAMRAISQRNELAQLGKVLAEHPEVVAQHLPADLIRQVRADLFQQPPQSATEVAPKPAQFEGIPDDLLRYMRLDENAPEQIKAKAAQFIRDQTIKQSPAYQALQNQLRELEAKIPKTNGQAVDPNQIADHASNVALQRVADETFVRSFFAENAHWIYPGGDPNKGTTADGVRFAHALQRERDFGTHPQLAIEHALKVVDDSKRQAITPTPSTPNKKAADNRANAAAPQVDPSTLQWDDSLDFAGNFQRIGAALGYKPDQLYA